MRRNSGWATEKRQAPGLPGHSTALLTAGAVAVALSSCITPEQPVPTPTPTPVALTAISVVTYDTSEMTIDIRGVLGIAGATAQNVVQFHAARDCSDAALGGGISSDFSGPGIQATVSSTQPTGIYVSTNTGTGCYFLTEFDPTYPAPLPPVFGSTSPASPSRETYTPFVFGTVSATIAQVLLFDDPACTRPVGSGPAANFSTIGIQATLQPNQTSQIYGEAVEPFGHASACTFLTSYTHSTTGPAAPGFVATSPASPSQSLTPLITGTASGDTANLQIFGDAGCSNLIGSGPVSQFLAGGITVDVAANAVTSIYGMALDASGNPSYCVYLTTFTNNSVAPAAPTFVEADPTSPTNSPDYPRIQGSAPQNPASLVPPTTVALFRGTSSPSGSNCTTQIGSGSVQQFQGWVPGPGPSPSPSPLATPGIPITIAYNATTYVYAESIDAAGNASPCTYLLGYVNNRVPPSSPTFISTNPQTLNNVSSAPAVIGSASGAYTVNLYSNSSCTNLISPTTPGANAAANFSNPSVGIQANIPESAPGTYSSDIYAVATDNVGNSSPCTFLTTYAMSTETPPAPSFTSISPISPSSSNASPTIVGTTAPSVAYVYFYGDSGCSSLIGHGSSTYYSLYGIQLTVPANASTTIYARSEDIYGNYSNGCTPLTTYTNENNPPLSPTLTSISPTSPSNTSTTPTVIGTTPQNPASVLPPYKVWFYSFISGGSCVNLLGSGLASSYSSSGITINVPPNANTNIYGQVSDQAGNLSPCELLTTFTNDTNPPGIPQLSSVTPTTPSYSQSVVVKGSIKSSSDILGATNVYLYGNSVLCTSNPSACCPGASSALNASPAPSTPSDFASTGIPITVTENNTSYIYGQTVDSVGNTSACTFLISYLEHDTGPTGVTPSQNSDGSVALSWNPDTIANPTPTYNVKRSIMLGGPYTVLSTGVGSPSFRDAAVSNGVTYYYVVSASNITGTSQDSTPEPSPAPSITISAGAPAVPSGLSASSGLGKISLSWTGASSDMYYKVYRGTRSGGPYSLVASELSSQIYSDTSASNGTSYYYVVAGTNPSGDSAYSNEASAAALADPSAPSGLNVVAMSSAPQCGGAPGAMLFWSAPSYYNQFNVFRGGSSGAEEPLASTSATNYVDCSPSTHGTNYPNYYYVNATWGTGQTSPSNEVSFANMPGPALTALPGNGNVVLNWTAVSGVSQIQVMRSTTQGGPYTVINSDVSASSFTDSSVSNGTAYFYVVQAVYAAGTPPQLGYPSNESSAIPGLGPSPVPSPSPQSTSSAPTNLVLTVSNKLPVLSWTPPLSYDLFNIYRASSSSGPYAVVATSTTPTYHDNAPITGMNYYMVTAVWGTYETASTGVVSFRSGVPLTISANAGSSSVTISWASVSGASDYDVMRSTTSGGPYTAVSTTASGPSYVDSSVTAGTGYFYVVSANFSDGSQGQNSSEVSATPGSGAVPSGLTAISTTNSSVGLVWAPIQGAVGYNVYQSTSSGSGYTKVTSSAVTSPSFTANFLNADTTYYFEVTSIVSGAESAKSSWTSAVTLSPPTVPIATPGSGQVGLSWGSVIGATYSVQRSTNGTTFSSIASGLSSASYTDSTVTNGQLYFYQIVATSGSTVLYSPISSGITPGLAPNSPAGLTVTANSDGTDVTLGWGSVVGATSYSVYRSTSYGSYGTAVLTTSSNTQAFVGSLSAGTTYYFSVTASNGTLQSSQSAQIAVIPWSTPSAPTVALGSGTSIIVTPPSPLPGSASTYDVQRSGDNVNFFTIASSTSNASYTDNTVSTGSPYVYRYLPRNSAGVAMAYSAASASITPGDQPLAPMNLVAEETPGSSSISLNWVQVPNAASYNVYRSVNGGSYALYASVSGGTTSYPDGSVTSPNSYFYMVTSVSTSGVESPDSNASGVTLSSAPTGLAASSGTNVINLAWNTATGASSYIVRRGTVSGGPYGALATGIGSTSYSDTSVTNGVTYFYVVDAVYASGAISNDSAQASATASQTLNLQVPIELTDEALSSSTSAVAFQRTLTSLDTTAYDGTVSYYVEAVAMNGDTAAHSINVIDSNSNVVGTISVPGSTSSPTRIRATMNPDSGTNVYRISLAATPSAGQLQVFSARMLVNQTGASKTKLYIPLLASSAAPSSSDGAAPVVTTSSLSYAQLASSLIWQRDTNVLATLNEYDPWELETVVSATNGTTGSVALYDDTQAADVSDTEALFSPSSQPSGTPSGTPMLVDSPFDDQVTNFASENESDLYEVTMQCQSGCSGGSVSLYKAGLWVSLYQLSSAEIIYRDSLGAASISAASTMVDERSLVDLTLFSNPTVLFQAVTSVSSGTVSVGMLTDGSSDTGTSGTSAISGSSVSVTSSAKTWMRSGSMSITSGNRFLTSVSPSGGSATLNGSAVVIQIAQ